MRGCRESQAEGASHSILRCPGSRKSMLVDPGSAGQLKTNENSCRVGMQSSLTHKLMYTLKGGPTKSRMCFTTD